MVTRQINVGDITDATGRSLDGEAEAWGTPANMINWLAALGELNIRDLGSNSLTAFYLPRTMTLSQSGTTVTATGGPVFEKGDEGRLIIFADGNEALIRTVPVLDPTTSTTCTVDRAQTISSQSARVQAKGPCLIMQGDSISYEQIMRLVKLMFRAYGFGGYVLSPLGDTTVFRISSVTYSGGASALADGSSTVFPQGSYFNVPSGGVATFGLGSSLFGAGLEQTPAFDMFPEDIQTDTALLIWERAAGAFTVERRRVGDKNWEAVATVADASTGATVFGRARYKHALGNWEYRVTGTSGTVKFVGCMLCNRTTPGLTVWPWNQGGSIVTTANTMPSATLTELVELINPDLRTYLYADYGQITDAGGTMEAALAATSALWDAAAPRTDTLWMGIWDGTGGDLVKQKADRDAVRLHARTRGDCYVGFEGLGTYVKQNGLGTLRDAVHQTRKGRGVTAAFIERVANFLCHPLVQEARNVNALQGRFARVFARGRDLLVDGRKGRAHASLKDRGAKWLQGTCQLVGASLGAAVGTSEITMALKMTMPATGSADLLQLASLSASGNAAGRLKVQYVSGTIRVALRNAANTGDYEYSITNIGPRYAGQTGWLYIRSNRTRDTWECWFDTEYAPTAGVQVVEQTNNSSERLDSSWAGLGTNVVIGQGSSLAVPIYGAMVWRSALTDAEILENTLADRFTTTVPDFFWDFSEQVGRVVVDRTGNKRHGLFQLSGTSQYNIGTGPTWLGGGTRRALAPAFSPSAQNTVQAIANEEIVSDRGSLQTITLPAAPELGDRLRIVGKGNGKWAIAQPAGHQILEGAGGTVGTNATTAGTGGTLTAANRYDMIELECITADSVTPSYIWSVISRSPTAMVFV